MYRNETKIPTFSVANDLHFTLEVAQLPPDTFRVVKFDFEEGYNSLFKLSIVAATQHNQLPFGSLLDCAATLSIWQDGERQRNISGIVTQIKLGKTGERYTFYHFTLSPHLWRLTQKRRSRIFQHTSIEAILKTLLSDSNVLFHTIDIAYRTRREYCVQYRETDYEFFQRIIGEEGLFFFCTEDEHNQIDRLFIYDDAHRLSKEDTLSLDYNANPTVLRQAPHLRTFQWTEQIRPSEVLLKDYTFKKPNWNAEYGLQGTQEEIQFQGDYPYYDYPGRYKNDSGERFAQYRLDSLRRDAHMGEGESNHPALRIGQLLHIHRHPRADFNQPWQLTYIQHHGEQPQALEEESHFSQRENTTFITNRFECLSPEKTFRSNFPQKPQICGTQTAVVTGPKGEEIFTDYQGRVKVKFHWDKGEFNDSRSSCWVRVAQPWAGQNWGMLAIPRVGQEVVVSFLEGDPDQPLIIGRVYNELQIPPGNLPATYTQMHIKSKTYKGEGYNSILFEDAANRELFEMHAQRDMTTRVEHDQKNHIKNHRTLTVNGNQRTQIDQGRTTQITTGNDIKTVLAGNNLETISLLKAIQAKEIFNAAHDRIELEVGKQTSLTMDNEKILLRFGKNTILMNEEGIWLDGVHIGMQEKELQVPDNTGELQEQYDETFFLSDIDTGEKIVGYPFLIITDSGKHIFGYTNDNGEIPKIITGNRSEVIKIYFGDEALYFYDEE
ncbi:type VI secretion system tip protein VgrG [Avibacterium sp. 20-15]|uniref:type VI secretion system Vgr family protein n=1 Tax=Avibacterium sp. 20-15 TaxID=2911523 RepID=UPI0022471E9A|nr:type VI secretion system tip protein TssI/VgrG [Avibacterium sp. 20-15]MCW9734073.1 type VI secretion system tip protein VgrG [Avibacterium sp. 20-15]